MFDKLEDLLIRYEEIMGELQEPDVVNDQSRFRKLMKEQNDLTPIVEAYKEYKNCKQNIEDSLSLLEEESDEEMKELAKLVYETGQNTFKALATMDSKWAKNLILDDDNIDKLEYEILQKYPQIGISFTAKALERIADHATNVCESIIYAVEGIDVRHENTIRQRMTK